MKSRAAFPFLVLTDEAIRFDGWMIGDPGLPLLSANDLLEHWDYARDLEVSALISIDWDRAAQELQLPKDKLQLKLSLLAGTGVGNMPRRQDRLRDEVADHTSSEFRLSSVVSGRTLSGRLRLSLQVAFDGPVGAGTLLSPVVRGSRLWQSRLDILIEDGGDSRFPMEIVSFSKCFRTQPQENSPWFLHWRPNALQVDFSGCIRLYVNSDCEEISARFADGDEPTLQAILGDVVSQMVASVLNQEDCSEILAECEEGSVGQQIRGWLEIAFPGQEASSVRAMRDQFPGRFRAAILAASDMGVSG